MDKLLFDINGWNVYIEQQKEICNKLNVPWIESQPYQMIGLADINDTPIHGLRHPIENNSAGWYVWAKEYSSDPDFFKPFHIVHLLEIKPQLLKYLGLPPGYRFLIDNNGYENIWYDKTLLLI